MERNLQDVIRQLPGAVVTGNGADRTVSDLTIDSRTAGPGSFLYASKGSTPTPQVCAKAAAQGAVAALTEQETEVPEGLTVIRVPSTQEAVKTLAPWFYDWPARKMRMIGVTGTNGKTTTTNILRTF